MLSIGNAYFNGFSLINIAVIVVCFRPPTSSIAFNLFYVSGSFVGEDKVDNDGLAAGGAALDFDLEIGVVGHDFHGSLGLQTLEGEGEHRHHDE